MSFLSYIDLDPHIHLFALKKLSPQETQELVKERIHHLLMTRRFDELLAETTKLEGLTFPDLQQQLQQAKKQSVQQKVRLGSEDVDGILARLDVLSSKDDADFKEIDEGQLNIYKLAKIYYEEGEYEKAYEIVKKLQKQYLNQTLDIKTTWARLYCEILLEDPKVRKTVQRLKRKIDEYEKKQKLERKTLSFNESNKSIRESYSRRKEFLNLITIAYFLETKDQSYEKYVDYCSEEENSAVIQLFCPYIVRYLCVALILNKTLHKNRKFDLFNLIEALRRKIYKYSDPFVEFLTQLNIEFDFEAAKQKISEIKKCISSDILLRPLQNKIIENCYFLYFKVYCKVYEKVPLSEIAEFIGKSEDQAQMWILGFIRSLDIEAKIDSVKRVVVSSREEESLNEKYIDLIPKMNSFINTLSQAAFVQN